MFFWGFWILIQNSVRNTIEKKIGGGGEGGDSPVVRLVVEFVRLDEGAEDAFVARVLQRLGHVRRVAEGDDGDAAARVGLRHDADSADRAAATLVLVVQLLTQLTICRKIHLK